MKNRGFTLIGALMAAAVALVVILGINKSLVMFSQQTAKVIKIQDLSEMQTVVKTILQSDLSWGATVYKAFMTDKSCYPGKKAASCPSMSSLLMASLNDETKCYPGSMKREKGGNATDHYCPLDFYYNPTKPDDIDKYISNGKLKRWICTLRVNGKIVKGVGFLVSGGMPIYLTDEECKFGNPEKAVRESRPNLTNDYVRVNIYPPDPAAEGYMRLPTFKVELEDSYGTKTKKQFFVW